MIRFNEGLPILKKVQDKNFEVVSDGASSRNPFDLQSNEKFLEKNIENALLVYLPKGKRGYIMPQNIPGLYEKRALIYSWKVLVAKASPGEDSLPHAVISSPIVSEPGSLCTDSHLVVSVVENREQAENLVAYMKTRFFRFMMILAKNGHNMTKDTFCFVPVLSLNKRWSDKELYELFGLTVEECNYINSIVKEPRA